MTDASSATEFVLRLRCPDRPGIVHAVSGFIVNQGANIVASHQFGDAETGPLLHAGGVRDQPSGYARAAERALRERGRRVSA